MLYYFRLQNKLFQRAITDGGVNLILGYIILPIVFVGGSMLLFGYRPAIAVYLYPCIGLFCVLKLSKTERNTFLKMCFSKRDYLKIRIIENLIVVTPFVIFLLFKLLILPIAILVGVSILLVFIQFRNVISFTIPTPFSKHPFEFCVGFRKTFVVIVFLYFLTIMAIISDNSNLGLSSLIMLYIVLLSYYFERERQYYIWIFNMSPSRFLLTKVKTALSYSTLLAAPIVLALSIHTPDRIGWLLLIVVLGFAYLTTIILAKYSYLTEEVGVSLFFTAIIIIYVPPLITIPWLYFKSINNLEKTLK